MLVARTGYLPVRHSLVPFSTDPVTIVLDSPALTISGCVVDIGGQPIAGARVWTTDGTKAQQQGSSSATLENIIGQRGDSSGSSRLRTTDASGRFEISGLLRAGYRIFAVHPQSLAVASAGKVEAGTVDLQLVLETAHAQRVTGHVLSTAGEPIEGAEIAGYRMSELNGVRYRSPFAFPLTDCTDAAGRFEIPELCTGGVKLMVARKGIDAVFLELDELVDLENIEVRCSLECSFQLVLADPSEADGLRVLDGKGEVLGCWVDLDGGQGVAFRKNGIHLAKGRSAITKTADKARWIALLANGREVRRAPVELAPGAPLVIHM